MRSTVLSPCVPVQIQHSQPFLPTTPLVDR